MVRAYGNPPTKLYFMGSSEGGREALTMAQRYPDDFDGIFARVPVINWVGLQHAGTRSGLATMGEGWIRPAQVELVAKAVLQACDKADGAEDLLVLDPVGCKAKFQPESLRCAAGQSGDACLTEAQIAAIKTLHSTYKFSFPLANGLDDYPGWGVSGNLRPSPRPEAGLPGGSAPRRRHSLCGPTGSPGSGGGTICFRARPDLDVTKYKPEDYKERVLEVSRLMDRPIGSEPLPRAGRQARDTRAWPTMRKAPMPASAISKCAAQAGQGEDGAVCAALRHPASTMSAPARRRTSTC
jgi:feruloyl esterase